MAVDNDDYETIEKLISNPKIDLNIKFKKKWNRKHSFIKGH